MVQPHATFSYRRADEVAECMDGVFSKGNLYEALWDIATKQQEIPNREDSGPHDHIGFESLASHWGDLSEEHQTILNELAEVEAAQEAKWRAEYDAANPPKRVPGIDD